MKTHNEPRLSPEEKARMELIKELRRKMDADRKRREMERYERLRKLDRGVYFCR